MQDLYHQPYVEAEPCEGGRALAKPNTLNLGDTLTYQNFLQGPYKFLIRVLK